MTEREKEIIEIIHAEVKPALGCTEPIAVALATAKAVEVLAEYSKDIDSSVAQWRPHAVFEIDVAVSGNILKNGMGVGIPGTGMIGMPIAAALGAVCGRSEYGLEVLKDMCSSSVAMAKKLEQNCKVHIGLAETRKKLYVEASVRVDGSRDRAVAVVEDAHDHIAETSFNGQVLFSDHLGGGDECSSDRSRYGLTVREIYDFAKSADFQDIKFILEDRDYNLALACEGLKGDYGLKVGKT